MSKYDKEYYRLEGNFKPYINNEQLLHYIEYHPHNQEAEDIYYSDGEQFPTKALLFANAACQVDEHIMDHWPGVIGDLNDVSGILVKKWVRDLIFTKKIDGLQLFYSVFRDCFGDYHEPLYYFHFYKTLDVWHRERSSIISEHTYGDHVTYYLEKISLNENILDAIPLDKRLIFKIGTVDHKPVFFHKSLVDQFKAHGFEGVHFIRVDEWDPYTGYETSSD